jgi:hypothetical protein
MAVDGYAHFKEFYNKLNVVCELSKTQVKDKLSKIDSDDKIKGISTKKHIPDELIQTFIFDTQTPQSKYTTELTINIVNSSISIIISQDIKYNGKAIDDAFTTNYSWFDEEKFKLFTIDTTDPYTNVVALNSVKAVSNNLEYIKTLFEFKDVAPTKYVWERKLDMLALINRPVMLLAFDMYYYNNSDKKQLFTSNFDIEATELDKKISVHSLSNMAKFDLSRRPTFIMLLMYYAGYSFNIKSDDITKKFSNKFYNGNSFEIKLYAPIDNQVEIDYNNLLKSTIKPTSVDLEIETLEVYHIGKIASLWDYVNGKLTILINNMLTHGTDKDYYKALLKKEYTSNSLFLMECIKELKKYKEYIINPQNITTIAYPISTLKTIEILILKLSYILSILEPTFIPVETMSFDLIMDGKKFKYVINSELQATNISVEDHISNDRLMAAILSIREFNLTYLAAEGTAQEAAIDKAITNTLALIPNDEAKSIYIRKFDKEASIYKNIKESNVIEKGKLEITLSLLDENIKKLKAKLDAEKTDTTRHVKYNTDNLKLLETKLDLAVLTYRITEAGKKVKLAQKIKQFIMNDTIDTITPEEIDNYHKLIVPNPANEKLDDGVKAIQTDVDKQLKVVVDLRTSTSTLGGSSKNTTKKVNRKQRQTHSKKKVFES